MTNQAHILVQNYVDAVWNYRLERDSGAHSHDSDEEKAMDASEAELTKYIDDLERLCANGLAALGEDVTVKEAVQAVNASTKKQPCILHGIRTLCGKAPIVAGLMYKSLSDAITAGLKNNGYFACPACLEKVTEAVAHLIENP